MDLTLLLTFDSSGVAVEPSSCVKTSLVNGWVIPPTYLTQLHHHTTTTTPPPQQHHHNNTTTTQLPLPPLLQKHTLPPSSRTAGPPRPPSANDQVRDPNHRNCHASGAWESRSSWMYVWLGSVRFHPCTCPILHRKSHDPSTHPSARARATQVIYFHHPSYPHPTHRWKSPGPVHRMRWVGVVPYRR
ncbi:hypothetical protein B0T18DRAFT_26467 [Schizothecium vesticola]|uniref:Uncharacterized protein n=1 Tax=Schizothecium vesticola TaxID=314040 RepID=A0AA40KCB8_9PEZI|nr:hypothetical protein B0T18DRAFT_26467 [Schizothecium vesticola]